MLNFGVLAQAKQAPLLQAAAAADIFVGTTHCD